MNNGRLLAILLITVGIFGGLVDGSQLYSNLLYLGILLSLGAWIWALMVRNSAGVRRHARTLRANVGDIFIEHFEVIHPGRVMIPWIEISNESPLPYSSGSRLLTMFNPRQRRSYLARTWLTKRGKFPLGPTRITTGDPFGLFRFSKIITASQSLIVLPMLFNIRSFLSLPGLLPGGQVIRLKAQDLTPHASGVREYSPGDPMKRIHWTSSLRKETLMVKEFELDPQSEVWIVLDAQEGAHFETESNVEENPMEIQAFGRRPKFQLPASTLEYAISITASLARHFIRQHRAVGLLTEGSVYTLIPAERGARQESKILETLAFLEDRGSLSFAELITTQLSQFPQGSMVILVSTYINNALLITAENLRKRNLKPVVILLEKETFAGNRESGENLDAYRTRRIPVCRIDYGDDLGLALSSMMPAELSMDYREWQKPKLPHLI